LLDGAYIGMESPTIYLPHDNHLAYTCVYHMYSLDSTSKFI